MTLVGQTVAPGDQLYRNGADGKNFRCGEGTYEDGGIIYSSVVGIVEVFQDSLVVASEKHRETMGQVIMINDVVIGRVVRLTEMQITVEILFVNGNELRVPNLGVVRTEDVTSLVVDAMVMSKCFRLGDIIEARVISLGDSRQFYLSTAADELGVIKAVCENSGSLMYPVSWKEMMCPTTGERENRKCAKPKEAT